MLVLYRSRSASVHVSKKAFAYGAAYSALSSAAQASQNGPTASGSRASSCSDLSASISELSASIVYVASSSSSRKASFARLISS